MVNDFAFSLAYIHACIHVCVKKMEYLQSIKIVE